MQILIHRLDTHAESPSYRQIDVLSWNRRSDACLEHDAGDEQQRRGIDAAGAIRRTPACTAEEPVVRLVGNGWGVVMGHDILQVERMGDIGRNAEQVEHALG